MRNTIYLNDVLNLSDEQIKNTKLRFMVDSIKISFNPSKDAEDPKKQDDINLRYLVNNSSKVGLFFKQGIIAIGFIPIGEHKWLMTGIVSVTKDNGIGQPATAQYLTNKYNYRLVVKYHKKSRGGILKAENIIDDLEVIEIWNPSKGVTDNSFPGYKNVRIGFNDLKNKLTVSDEWKTALSLRKGVYLITDKQTGKLYVGSAYGKNGILGRWLTYVNSGYDKNELENGKYPNKELKALVKREGMDYIKKNFVYSLLETFTEDVSDEYVISRESWWKETLLSRLYGYNAN